MQVFLKADAIPIDLTPGTDPLVRWEIECMAHAARSANKRGGTRPSELCGLALIYGKDLCAMLPDLSNRIAVEMHQRFADLPEEPTNWKASSVRCQFLATLYQRLDQLSANHA